MPPENNKFYVTTPIYYVNARPHIGHAYTTIVADVLARRHRLLGDDTFFLTGTDEHGQKIERSAAAAGVPPQQFADEVSAQFRALWDRMGLTYDRYIRTTDPKHARGVQKLFSELYARGFIELRDYTGSYCVSDETFVDAPAGTPCPDCGRLLEIVTEENFFFKLSAFQRRLIDLIESDELRITPSSRKNEVLSFLIGSFTSISEASKADPDCPDISGMTPRQAYPLLKERGIVDKTSAGQMYQVGALKDLSISRSSFTWGIPVPEPAASEAKQKHVIYVWLDALANYMTAIGYGSDDPKDAAEYAKYWPADLHLVGKEIIRFHCVYWPAFLLAANLPLPKAITAHGWLLFDNAKMSKSKGNIVRTETILEAFGTLCPPAPSTSDISNTASATLTSASDVSLKGTASAVPQTTPSNTALAAEVRLPTPVERDLFASDVLRYFLLREIPFGQDGSFSFDSMYERYNAELTNGYGNLVSRTLAMIAKYFEGSIPTSIVGTEEIKPRTLIASLISSSNDENIGYAIDIPSECSALPRVIEADFQEFGFAKLLEAVSLMISLVDGHLTTNAPWKPSRSLSDEEVRKVRADVLVTAAESIRIITALLYPILPFATARVWSQLGLGDIELAAKSGELNNLQWGGLQPGTKLGPLTPIFPRAPKELADIMSEIEDKNALETQNAKRETDKPTQPPLEPNPPAGAPALVPPTEETVKPSPITIDDFAKIELRVAQIVVAERIPKADKLLRLEVDLGYERRQILSGIAEWYTPEELLGRRIVVITNLAPRKMRGLESHGMLLAASEGEGGKPVLATFSEEIALGSRLK